MRYLKLFENFKVKNITKDDVIDCIKRGGFLYATIIKDFPKNNPKDALKPVSIDDDGLITVEYEGKEYELDIKNVEKIDIPKLNEIFESRPGAGDISSSWLSPFYYKKDPKFIIVSYGSDNEFKRYVLENVEETLKHFYDEDFIVTVGYNFPLISSKSLKFNIGGKPFSAEDIKYLRVLDDFLKREGFIPVGDNVLKDVDISFKFTDSSNRMHTYSLSRFEHSVSKGWGNSKADWIIFEYKIPENIQENGQYLIDDDKSRLKYRDYKESIENKLNYFNNRYIKVSDFEIIKCIDDTFPNEKWVLDVELCEYLLQNLDLTKEINDDILQVIQDAKDDISEDIDIELKMMKPIGIYESKSKDKIARHPRTGMTITIPPNPLWLNEQSEFDIKVPYNRDSRNLRNICKLFNNIVTRLDALGQVRYCSLDSETINREDELFFKIVFNAK